jgi:DNA repair protein SbcD/Mre11
MLKVIHCADLHLDSPMETHMSQRQAEARNTEIIHSFLRLTEYAVENEVRIVLIAGDLFDGQRVKKRTVDEILDAIRRTPMVDYLYLAGNHDESSYAFADQKLPENLKFFGREWKSYEYEEAVFSGIEICEENAESLYHTIPYEAGEKNIVILHGQVGSTSGPDQINLNLLKNKGIDYLALGHIHSYSAQALDNKGIYCYSGCLEGRGFDECGEKGFVLLTIEDNYLQHEFIPFSSRQLHRIAVDISGLTKNSEIAQKMKMLTRQIPPEDMVEFLLRGEVDPEANIALSYLQDLFVKEYFFVKIKDETRMAIHPEDYKNDISLKGEFIRLVLASDAEEKEKATMIRTGLQALLGEEITL